MRDVDVNVDLLNETLFKSGLPGLRLSRIFINTLSMQAPIMTLKTKPIIIYADELFIEISEFSNTTKKPKEEEKADPKKNMAKYGFVDRVIDSLSFEVNRIIIAIRTLGEVIDLDDDHKQYLSC
jgi:hypothetical protein